MPKYEVEYEYTTVDYGIVEVEADSEEDAAEAAYEAAELPWDFDTYEVTRVDKIED